jgi:hypothetical protein
LVCTGIESASTRGEDGPVTYFTKQWCATNYYASVVPYYTKQ